jgi:hypothetical protein
MKSNQVLFAANSSGRLFALQTDSFEWRELEFLGIEFKRISAAKNSIWALGGDHQLYVRLFGVEVPIRVKEVNQIFQFFQIKKGTINRNRRLLCHVPSTRVTRLGEFSPNGRSFTLGSFITEVAQNFCLLF